MKKNLAAQLAIELYNTLQGLGEAEQANVVREFVAILAKRHALKTALATTVAFEEYAKKQEGIVEIHVTSAHELSQQAIKAVASAFGNKVETTLKVDSTLLGGIKVKTNDKIFDGSLKTQLQRLQQQLS